MLDGTGVGPRAMRSLGRAMLGLHELEQEQGGKAALLGARYMFTHHMLANQEHVSVAENPAIGDDGVVKLAASLGDQHCKVAAIDLTNCGVRLNGAKALAAALAKRTFELIIAKNKLGKEGKAALADVLPDSKYGLRKAAAEAKAAALELTKKEREELKQKQVIHAGTVIPCTVYSDVRVYFSR
jgi:hypothetical protein